MEDFILVHRMKEGRTAISGNGCPGWALNGGTPKK